MKNLLVAILLLGTVIPVYAEKSAEQQSHEYNLIFQAFLVEKIQSLPKNVPVQIVLKNKKTVLGTFTNYLPFDESVWIIPLKSHGFFNDDAYDISEIQDIRVLKLSR